MWAAVCCFVCIKMIRFSKVSERLTSAVTTEPDGAVRISTWQCKDILCTEAALTSDLLQIHTKGESRLQKQIVAGQEENQTTATGYLIVANCFFFIIVHQKLSSEIV